MTAGRERRNRDQTVSERRGRLCGAWGMSCFLWVSRRAGEPRELDGARRRTGVIYCSTIMALLAFLSKVWCLSPRPGPDPQPSKIGAGSDLDYCGDVTNYRFEDFKPTIDESTGEPDERTKGYFASTSVGFHDARSTDKALKARVERAIADGRNLTAVYADQEYAHGLDSSIPVATFAWFEKLVNVGGGRLVPGHLITWITVRPTHRRRGLLRSMMTTDLAEAKAGGYPFAALTATEGGIYSRFGFGVATWSHSIEVDTSPGFKMVREPDRRVEMCLPSELRELAPKIYDRFMRTSPGAMERQQTYIERATGALNTETGKRIAESARPCTSMSRVSPTAMSPTSSPAGRRPRRRSTSSTSSPSPMPPTPPCGRSSPPSTCPPA
jgi:predicted N-acetyltransferase YhbS